MTRALTRRLPLLLVAVLVFAQWGLLRHQVEVDQHASDHACGWCLAYGHLSDAAPAVSVPPLAPTHVPVSSLAPREGHLAIASAVYRSRAPPPRSI